MKKPIQKKQAWPTKKAMEQVYHENLWGSNLTEFYSGEGSHDAELVQPYVLAVRSFLSSFKNPLVVCDLGCGDFNIGKALVPYAKKYTAVDIVPDLIRHNKNTFKAENLEFLCLDIALDDLPKADCVILRQVLQHLSNAEIAQIVTKLNSYPYIILTEHLPGNEFEPNIDIISGQGIRLKKSSGVNLLAPPFNLKIKAKKKLLELKPKNDKGVIITYWYETL